MKGLPLLNLLATLFLPALVATDRPVPPAGFTWQEVPELKAAFLRPDGWFFKREKDKGTLAPGMLADLVVLDTDITAVAPEKILATKVLRTVVAGKTVYQAK